MYAFFIWSRSVRADTSDYATLILSDGSTAYSNWWGCCWLPHGVAYDHFGGRGVFILVSVVTTGTRYGLEVLRVVPMDIVVLIILTELPMFAFIVWSRSNGQVDTHCSYIILDDGLGLYGKGSGYSWLVHGVARYVCIGRGVCI